MQQFKYSIELEYLKTETSEVILIKAENIKSIIIDRDYDNTNMPIISAVLILDKNLIDDMITNASVNIITMTIYKFVNNAPQKIKEVYVKDQFSYIITGDLNDNKDIDYGADDNKDRKDIYKSINIGLMRKKSIEDNKKSFNATILATNMVSIVNMCVKHMKILIEPFTYNKTIDQLIVPPIDSVSKTLKFLNSVAVFYDTHYRFFIDFDTAYLISSSGDPITKQGDTYPTVMINVHKSIDYEANTIGMTEDKENECYNIEMNISDTKYMVDKNTEKSFNNMTAVLDTSKEKSKPSIGSIRKTIDHATKYIKNLNKTIKDKVSNLTEAHSTSRDSGKILNYNVSRLQKNKGPFVSAVTSIRAILLPASADVRVKSVILNIDKAISDLDSAHEGLADGLKTYADIHNGVTKNVDDSINILSYVNGVDPVNIRDNIYPMQKLSNDVDKTNTIVESDITNNILPMNDKAIDIKNATNITDQLDALPDTIESATGSGTSSDGSSSSSIDISAIRPHVVTLKDIQSDTNSAVDNISNSIEAVKKLPGIISNMHANIGPILGNIDKLPNNLNSSLLDGKATPGDNLTSLISGKINGGSFGFDKNTLENLKNSLDHITDISNVGSMGIPKLDVALNLGSNSKDSEKKKIVRVNNDNANMIKNVKNQIELNTVKLSLNKNDLDASVLTINKEYIIKNSETHADKDGRFLLSRKRELFIRENEDFFMNTMLDFKRLKE